MGTRIALAVCVVLGCALCGRALADAARRGKIYLGVDVYSREPFGEDHPFYAIRTLDNVCLTPHMAWGSAESRARCVREMAENTRAFFAGEHRNRIV